MKAARWTGWWGQWRWRLESPLCSRGRGWNSDEGRGGHTNCNLVAKSERVKTKDKIMQDCLWLSLILFFIVLDCVNATRDCNHPDWWWRSGSPLCARRLPRNTDQTVRGGSNHVTHNCDQISQLWPNFIIFSEKELCVRGGCPGILIRRSELIWADMRRL